MRANGLVVVLPLLLTQCAAPPPDPNVRVCDAAGCRDQDRGAETSQPSEPFTERSADPRLAALVARAESGDVEAAYDLGLAYLTGSDGAVQNGGVAMRWLRRAAEGGDAEAQLILGRLYLTGYETVGQDVNEADRWLRAAAMAGGKSSAVSEEAQKLLVEVERERAKKPDWDKLMVERRRETEVWLRELAAARGPYLYGPSRPYYGQGNGRPRRY